MWSIICSQTACPAWSASASQYPRQSDHTSGAYRSTIASHARWSPSRACITRPVTGTAVGTGAASTVIFVISFRCIGPLTRAASDTGHWRSGCGVQFCS